MSQPRTAFITGASSGIGAALAKRLAKRGTKVALAARRADALDAVARDIAQAGGEACCYPLDVTDAAAVYEVMGRADEEMDGIDLVVANAGIATGRWGGKLEWKHIEPTLMVNVVGASATLAALLPRMVERQRGHLVGISSLAAYRGLPKQAAYSASKAYLSAFLESLRVDLRSTKVAVTDIRPGYVKTPLTDGNKPLPMAMEVDDAAREIEAAIAGRKSIHAFPLPLATVTRSLSTLPNGLYDIIARKVL